MKRADERLRGPLLLILWVLIFQLLFFSYFPAIKGEFVYDDIEAVVGNEDLRFPQEPWRLLRDHEISLQWDRRPVAGLLTLVDFQLWGLNPSGYRITNIAVHFLCGMAAACFLVLTARRFGCPCPRIYGHLVAMVWLFHPLSTSAVSFIFQRSELLMALWYLLCLTCLALSHRDKASGSWRGLALACAFLSALSKETGLTLLVFLPLYDRLCGFSSWKEMWRRHYGFYCTLCLGFGLMVFWILSGSRLGELDQPRSALNGSFAYFSYQCVAVARYLRLTFFPYPLVFMPGGEAAPVMWKWVSCLILLSGLCLAVIRAGWKTKWPWLCLAAVLTILAPTSSFIPLPLEPEAEFRMYLPCMFIIAGLFAWAGSVFPGVSRTRWWPLVITVVLMLEIVVTVGRNADYGSALRLWGETVKNVPSNGKAWANLGFAALDRGRFDIASDCGSKLLAWGNTNGSEPLRTAGLRIQATIELLQGDPGKAVGMMETLVKTNPKLPGVQVSLAAAHEKAGEPLKALAILERYYPDPLAAHPSVAALYRRIFEQQGRRVDADRIGRYLESMGKRER